MSTVSLHATAGHWGRLCVCQRAALSLLHEFGGGGGIHQLLQVREGLRYSSQVASHCVSLCCCRDEAGNEQQCLIVPDHEVSLCGPMQVAARCRRHGQQSAASAAADERQPGAGRCRRQPDARAAAAAAPVCRPRHPQLPGQHCCQDAESASTTSSRPSRQADVLEHLLNSRLDNASSCSATCPRERLCRSLARLASSHLHDASLGCGSWRRATAAGGQVLLPAAGAGSAGAPAAGRRQRRGRRRCRARRMRAVHGRGAPGCEQAAGRRQVRPCACMSIPNDT